MLRLALIAAVLAAAPLGAQTTDSAAIAAAALRESPTPDSGTVMRLAVRGDTATVTVLLDSDERQVRGHTLTLVRRAGRWVALPRRELFVGTLDRRP